MYVMRNGIVGSWVTLILTCPPTSGITGHRSNHSACCLPYSLGLLSALRGNFIMSNSGLWLEELVKRVEEGFAKDSGFKATSRVRLYSKRKGHKRQVAEFDIVVEGMVGLNPMTILYECRDRPSQGPAPSQWLEGLVGRKIVHKFNSVIAVSTSGFSAGAYEIARDHLIGTRNVEILGPEAFLDWFNVTEMPQIAPKLGPKSDVKLFFRDEIAPNDELRNAVKTVTFEQKAFIFLKTGETKTLAEMVDWRLQHRDIMELPPGVYRSDKIGIQCGPSDADVAFLGPSGSVPLRSIAFINDLSIHRSNWKRTRGIVYKTGGEADSKVVVEQITMRNGDAEFDWMALHKPDGSRELSVSKIRKIT
jgi:hypothetical protein